MAKGKKTGGRQKGTPNKATTEVREALTQAFQRMGDVPALVRWAKKNPEKFYPIWSKLIPTQITGANGGPLQTDLTSGGKPLATDDERVARIAELLDAARTRRNGTASIPERNGTH